MGTPGVVLGVVAGSRGGSYSKGWVPWGKVGLKGVVLGVVPTQGSLKDTFRNHLKHGFFNTKIKSNPMNKAMFSCIM